MSDTPRMKTAEERVIELGNRIQRQEVVTSPRRLQALIYAIQQNARHSTLTEAAELVKGMNGTDDATESILRFRDNPKKD